MRCCVSTLRQRADLRWPDPEREPVAYLAAFHSHPAWIVERWLQRFGFEATRALCITTTGVRNWR
jgi:16S rRNA (cytosine967-C5)-methyltransferase